MHRSLRSGGVRFTESMTVGFSVYRRSLSEGRGFKVTLGQPHPEGSSPPPLLMAVPGVTARQQQEDQACQPTSNTEWPRGAFLPPLPCHRTRPSWLALGQQSFPRGGSGPIRPTPRRRYQGTKVPGHISDYSDDRRHVIHLL
ncbi:hypothetical protein PSACC_00058 [Paramicrosporidium saccamoebae]|uniref:Uncharacterized protein n=1 Tax=Paramicrosporidium saccamoebae TaxID=1246581 RepID=A0A2H9TQV2_9FUNG|nr:hypothetical protein PSACC_00058 [Paramicrosporidium saccamoebae]